MTTAQLAEYYQKWVEKYPLVSIEDPFDQDDFPAYGKATELLGKGCQIVGVFWGDSTRRDPAGHAENMADLFRLYSEGRIRPRISAAFPLNRAGEALTMMQDRKVMGKVVVTID